MKRGVCPGFIYLFLFNALGLISLNGFAQEMRKPISKPILLSGNFGELRATHFHSGIDIRTGGQEGLPVVCVKDGVLVRVSVSPTGYGQALYIGHADGTTTVYGHLQRFVPVIAGEVRRLQYQQESFKIDEDFRSYHLVFRKGDTIAYSGNTGSSGGPHLHFEVRDTKTEHTLNPLHYYNIRDTKPPVVKKIYLYSVAENGCVDLIRQYPVKAVSAGKYQLGRLTVPAGKIGLGVFVIDYMEDSWNKLGVYRLQLLAGQDTLFCLGMDSCSFDQNCFINEVKDFDGYKKKETVYRCFGNYQHQFSGIRNLNKGCINVEQDSVVKVRLLLADINGNRSVVSLEVKGSAAKTRSCPSADILRYDEAHLLELPGCQLELESGALFHSVEKVLEVEKDSLTGRDIFVLSKKDIPLFRKGRLTISGEFDRQAVICEMDCSGRKYPVDTRWAADALRADISYLNRYTVVEDREAPVITFLGKFPDGTLRFRIKDKLSGIATYRGEVNGQWCLFSYDPRIDLLQCRMMEPAFVPGKINEIKIIVEDKVGNKAVLLVKS